MLLNPYLFVQFFVASSARPPIPLYPYTHVVFVQGSRFKVQGSKFKVLSSKFKVANADGWSCRSIKGSAPYTFIPLYPCCFCSRFKVQSSKFKVQGSRLLAPMVRFVDPSRARPPIPLYPYTPVVLFKVQNRNDFQRELKGRSKTFLDLRMLFRREYS